MAYPDPTTNRIATDALSRARSNQSVANYPAIYDALMARGIPESEIAPRENVLTFHAWRALGRTVKRGEHGVKIRTWITCDKTDDDGEITETYRRPKTAIVFHVSQTKPLNGESR